MTTRKRPSKITITHLNELARIHADIAKRLHETATQIRSGEIHPAHVANRLDKVARELGG